MKKILIIGSGGSGKSTLAVRLGELLQLPVIHLDEHFWQPGWVEMPREEWKAKVAEFCSRDAWIMDGNYGGTLEERITASDTVLFLDRSRLICIWRIVKRRIGWIWGRRPGMAEGCRERLGWDFLNWVWNYPARNRPGILGLLQAVAGEKSIFLLTSEREVEDFVHRCKEKDLDFAS